jgi:hypothetical protein
MDIKAFAENSGDQLALLAFWAETVIARKMTAKEHKYFFMLNIVLSDTKIGNLQKASALLFIRPQTNLNSYNKIAHRSDR